MVEAPKGAPRVRSGSLPRLEVYGREGKEGCDEDAICVNWEGMEGIERVVELLVLYGFWSVLQGRWTRYGSRRQGL